MSAELWDVVIWPLIGAVATATASWIGLQFKATYEKYVNDKTKREVVRTCVTAAEQIYYYLSGPEKLAKAQEGIIEMLNEKGIPITTLEMNMLIESVVADFNWFRRQDDAIKHSTMKAQAAAEEGVNIDG